MNPTRNGGQQLENSPGVSALSYCQARLTWANLSANLCELVWHVYVVCVVRLGVSLSGSDI